MDDDDRVVLVGGYLPNGSSSLSFGGDTAEIDELQPRGFVVGFEQ